MTVREYPNIHSELIQHLFFSIRMNSLFVAAEYRNAKKYRARCPGLIIASGEDKTYFRIPMVSICFPLTLYYSLSISATSRNHSGRFSIFCR